jgi:ubiquinone/menaquinone biosynthesis C-methylase UbiE
MEDKLAASLNLPPGAYVLDAGCGVGHVAIHLARKHGLKVHAIDIVQHHLDKAERNVARADLPKNQVTLRKTDYHHLETLGSDTFDGIYTMETFVHATEPEAVLSGFFRILRPGGRISLFEYDHELADDGPEDLVRSMREINEFSAMPTNSRSHPGVFRQMLEDAGFTDVIVRDYSENVKPITRLFYVLAYIPFLIITFFGLQRYFINTVAGVQMHRGHGHWRYLAISARKPGHSTEVGKDR